MNKPRDLPIRYLAGPFLYNRRMLRDLQFGRLVMTNREQRIRAMLDVRQPR